MLPPGAVVGGHRVERQDAVTPSGERYAVRRVDDGGLRLLTVLAPDRALPEVVDRAVRLGRDLGRDAVRQGLLPVLAGGVDGGRAWVVTPYLQGEPLAAVLRREAPLEPSRALRLAADLARALGVLHDRGVHHGHLSPTGVLVTTRDGREVAVVADLGLGPARAVARDLTATGSVRQSLHHVAPEQLDGRGAGASSDQYALACVVTECLTGKPPFPRNDALATVTDHLRALPPRISDGRPQLPATVDPVLARALAKDPAARFPDAAAFVAALRSALADAGSGSGDQAELELAVVAGPAAGTAVPLHPGDTVVGRADDADVVLGDRLMSRKHLRLGLSGQGVVVEDLGSSNGTFVQGRRLSCPAALAAGSVLEAGASLLSVRRPEAGDHDLPALVHRALRRGPWPADTGSLPLRLGWRRDRGGPVPVALDLSGVGALVVRADPARRAALARAVLLQAAVLHAPLDLAVVAALPPTSDDLWSWVGLLPHARSGRSPVGGPHLATDRTSAGALLSQVAAVVAARDRLTREVDGGAVRPLRPRVLAVLDATVADVTRAGPLLRGGSANQVHVVWLTGPAATLPEGADVVVDVSEPAGDLVLQRSGAEPVTGVADGLSPSLARRAAGAMARG